VAGFTITNGDYGIIGNGARATIERDPAACGV
jgi:hypothetical protein